MCGGKTPLVPYSRRQKFKEERKGLRDYCRLKMTRQMRVLEKSWGEDGLANYSKLNVIP